MKASAYQHSASTLSSLTGARSSNQNQSNFLSKLQLKNFPNKFLIVLLSVGLNLTLLCGASLAQFLQFGNEGYEVEALQSQLSRLGYFNGSFTGYYGEQTRDAVTRFQRDNGLDPDGIYGPNTARALKFYVEEGSDYDYPGLPSNSSKGYTVVVPERGDDTLFRVRQYVPDAKFRDDRRGDYIQAGSFSSYGNAEREVKRLREFGFDARVIYF